MSGNNSRSVGLIYIWQREQISKWTLLGFLDIFQNKLDIGAFFISFIPVHATNGVLQTSSISYFDPFSSLFLLNFYIRIWVILVPQVPKNHHLHSFWLVTAWHCIITIPHICHFFSTEAIFGSIFLHTKVCKSRQNRFRNESA